VAVADIGTVTVEPGARVRLLGSRAGHHRMELARGTMHATIWAAAESVLRGNPVHPRGGSRLRLHADGGRGRRRPSHRARGLVGFTTGDRESFIPAGFAA
jgi:hypothetical protein